MLSWEEYPRFQTSSDHAAPMTHAEVVERIRAIQQLRPDAIRVEHLGRSVEGCPILLITVGTGGKRILAWSQMHGDEPTHTAVLLDLINFLQRAPDHPCVRAITEGCTLNLIPMLNPDGASRGTRRNAQDIDINRDARHLQSPEGRILRQAVHEISPHFAFNLHNQRARTTVGLTQQPAAVSLLVPAVDPQSSDTQNVAIAKKVASCFLRAVQPHCPGVVSRYDADFMPRAFGEWVQQQGTATVLVEAGGMPASAGAPLEHLHFHGLTSTLYDLATDAYLHADNSDYERLHRSGEHDLFDCLIREVTVANRNGQAPFMTDLGINFPHDGKPVHALEREATIQDLGDLHVTTGRTVIEGQDLLCLPGRTVIAPDYSPLQPPTSAMVHQLMATGVTSLIGRIDLTDEEAVRSLENLAQHARMPVNMGYLAAAPSSPEGWSDTLRDRLLFCMSRGILGVIAERLPADIQRYLQWFGLPLFGPRQGLHDVPECLAHLGRGSIRLGAVADLILIRASGNQTENGGSANTPRLGAPPPIDPSDLRQVIVGGNVSFDDGRVIHDSCGVTLTGRWMTGESANAQQDLVLAASDRNPLRFHQRGLP